MGFLAMIVGLCLLVVVHELGHWLAARSFGMWTPTFSVGFGPGFKLFRFWDTDFRFGFVLLGGYVAIPELNDETTAQEIAQNMGAEPRPLRTFPIWQRIVVACAGVVMNVIFAAVLVFGLFAFKGAPEYHFKNTYVAGFSQQITIAKDAGLQAKDIIVSADGVKIVDGTTLPNELKAHAGKPVVLHVQRGAAETDVTVVPNADGHIGIEIGANEDMTFRKMGIGESSVRAVTVTGKGLYSISYAVAGMLHLVPATPGAEVHSVVAIMQVGANAWAQGALQFVSILFSLSLTLAVFNILPVPILDGGYVVFFIVEKLRGRPVSMEIQTKLKVMCLFLLLGLMAFGLYNDFAHPIK